MYFYIIITKIIMFRHFFHFSIPCKDVNVGCRALKSRHEREKDKMMKTNYLKGHCHGDFNAFREKVLKLVNRFSCTRNTPSTPRWR